MRKNSVKNIRINSEVQREMSQIIREDIKDPRIHPMTSVMACEVTPDLKFAKIYVSVLGDDEAKEKTQKECRLRQTSVSAPYESQEYTGINIYSGYFH